MFPFSFFYAFILLSKINGVKGLLIRPLDPQRQGIQGHYWVNLGSIFIMLSKIEGF